MLPEHPLMSHAPRIHHAPGGFVAGEGEGIDPVETDHQEPVIQHRTDCLRSISLVPERVSADIQEPIFARECSRVKHMRPIAPIISPCVQVVIIKTWSDLLSLFLSVSLIQSRAILSLGGYGISRVIAVICGFPASLAISGAASCCGSRRRSLRGVRSGRSSVMHTPSKVSHHLLLVVLFMAAPASGWAGSWSGYGFSDGPRRCPSYRFQNPNI